MFNTLINTKYNEWYCHPCRIMVHGEQTECIRCLSKRPDNTERINTNAIHKHGEWFCTLCKTLESSQHKFCCGCGSPNNSDMETRPGDWVCLYCSKMQLK